jgi:zinc protease
MTAKPICALLAAVLIAGTLAGTALGKEGFFPYEIHKKTLENGLDVIVIPMPEFKDVLSYNTLVLAGARNEVEPGKSGLAHLFEHILFRHRWQDVDGGYTETIKKMGAFNNAWTWFDVTFYHPLTFTSNLDTLALLESSRFTDLDFTKKIFQTEAGAVLGEYRNSAANPGLKMAEVRLGLLYGSYGYGHTTIGFLEDVEDMPNEYEAAIDFYDTYYRPNNCVLIVTGDVDPNEIYGLAERMYGDWKPKKVPEIPGAEPVGGPKREDLDWEAEVPPRVQVSYRMPPFETGEVETGVGQLLPELLASDTAPLYQLLRFEKKTAASLSANKSTYESFGPGSLVVSATLFKEIYDEKGDALLDETVADIEQAMKDLQSFSSRADAEQTLEELKSKFTYDLLGSFDSPGDVAETFAWYYRFARDENVFDALVETIRTVTPEDVDAFARAYFEPENQVVVTLAHKGEEDES